MANRPIRPDSCYRHCNTYRLANCGGTTMIYFLTGATGFIGGHVAQQLLDAGHEVITLARTNTKVRQMEQLGYTAYRGDITDKESMRHAMQGADGVFHIAAWYKIGAK